MNLRLGRILTLVTALIVVGAAGLLYWSWVSQTSTWESGILVQLGTTLVLFVPLVIVGHSIETRIDSVRKQQEQISTRQEQTASDVAQLTEEVAQTQADLRLTREELSEVVRERIATRKDRDSSLFSDVGEVPSQSNVLNSLIKAKAMGIISDQGCRVDFISDCYLRFQPEWNTSDSVTRNSQDTDIIELTLERVDAEALKRIAWAADSSPAEITERVAEAMQASGVYPGDKAFDAGKIFADLSALLSFGYKSSTSGKIMPVRHIIQLCPPQWAVCDDGVYSMAIPYQIAAWRLGEQWIMHMHEKPWVDIESLDEALRVCRALYDAGALAVKPPDLEGTPS